jgi:cyclopropane fatty-acyl-phospholipid synthase-like methyltransferase
MADRYADWADRFDSATLQWIERLDAHLVEGAEVLELGCGAGRAPTQRLAERYRLTGVDISAEQIARARRNVPAAAFIENDIVALDFAPEAFDGVVSLYVFGHVPRDELGRLLKDIATWLRPGGVLLATFPTGCDPGSIEEDWLGVPMYFSSFDADTNRRLIRESGLTVLEERVLELEPNERFMWVVACLRRKTSPLAAAALPRATATSG